MSVALQVVSFIIIIIFYYYFRLVLKHDYIHFYKNQYHSYYDHDQLYSYPLLPPHFHYHYDDDNDNVNADDGYDDNESNDDDDGYNDNESNYDDNDNDKNKMLIIMIMTGIKY